MKTGPYVIQHRIAPTLDETPKKREGNNLEGPTDNHQFSSTPELMSITPGGCP